MFETASLFVAVGIVARGAGRGARGAGRATARLERLALRARVVRHDDEDRVLGGQRCALGLVIAALGLGLSEVLQSETPDGVASVLIGVILTAVAAMVGLQARSLLLGAAAHPDVRAKIREIVEEFDEVDTVVRLLTMQLGARSVLVTGELQLREDLSLGESEYVLRSIDAAIAGELPEVRSTFWELHRRPLDTPVATRLLE